MFKLLDSICIFLMLFLEFLNMFYNITSSCLDLLSPIFLVIFKVYFVLLKFLILLFQVVKFLGYNIVIDMQELNGLIFLECNRIALSFLIQSFFELFISSGKHVSQYFRAITGSLNTLQYLSFSDILVYFQKVIMLRLHEFEPILQALDFSCDPIGRDQKIINQLKEFFLVHL